VYILEKMKIQQKNNFKPEVTVHTKSEKRMIKEKGKPHMTKVLKNNKKNHNQRKIFFSAETT
jgi:hypothetical protein